MLILLPLLAPAPVDVLDVGPGRPYADIGDAVIDAVDGDVIRVAGGTYGSFAVRGKSLTLIGGPGVVVEGVVRVQELAHGQHVSLQGLDLRVIPWQEEERLIVGLNQGSVRLEDVTVARAFTTEYLDPLAGARVVSSADVTFVDCVLEPKIGYDAWFERVAGGPGLLCSASSVALYDCDVAGEGNNGQGFPAEHGIQAHDCDLELFGVAARGSYGGDTYLTFAGNCRGWAGPGGHGVFASDSAVTAVDCQLDGGWGGQDTCTNPWTNYPDGEPIALGAGATLFEGPGTTPVIRTAPSVQEGASFSVGVTTDPGDVAFLLASLEPDRAAPPGLVGALLVNGSTSYRRIPLGSSGSASLTLTAPQLSPLATMDLHLQIACLRADPAQGGAVVPVLGTPQVVTVLDSAW